MAPLQLIIEEHLEGYAMTDEFEIHGPHDHAVEHASHGDTFSARIAVMTAILATLGAFGSYQSGNTENLALIAKNEAAISKTEAAKQWGYFQAKGEKQNLAELGAAIVDPTSAARSKFEADVNKYREQKEPIRQQAEALEKDVERANARSETLLHSHHHWAQATTAVQISIALAAITLLTRKRWLQVMSFGVAVCGVSLGAAALLSW
ncbi:hypothetical protein P3T16_004371 [Paraburkholderia sp. GAS42]